MVTWACKHIALLPCANIPSLLDQTSGHVMKLSALLSWTLNLLMNQRCSLVPRPVLCIYQTDCPCKSSCRSPSASGILSRSSAPLQSCCSPEIYISADLARPLLDMDADCGVGGRIQHVSILCIVLREWTRSWKLTVGSKGEWALLAI